MSNARYTQFFYTPHKAPVLLDCNFIIDPANGNGYGVRALKGQGISRVYMNSTASITGTVATTANQITAIAQGTSSLQIGMPVQGTGIPAQTVITSIISSSAVGISATPTGNHASETITYQAPGSPNPNAGNILVQFTDNFRRYFGGFSGFVSPVSGSAIAVTTGVTAGLLYTIVVLGNTSLAQWQKLGVPVGTVPAVGVTFMAPVTTTATGTGFIEVPAAAGSTIDHIEAIGDPNTTIQSSQSSTAIVGQSSGAYIWLACFANSVLTAPVSQSGVGLAFYFSNSKIMVDGE
jgi:hypothetical protein